MRRRIMLGAALAIVAGGCTSDATPVLDPTTPSPTTTTLAPTTTTSTTLLPDVPVAIESADADPDILDQLTTLYSWLADRNTPKPDMSAGLRVHIGDATVAIDEPLSAEVFVDEAKGMGMAAVAVVDDDIVLLVNDLNPTKEYLTGWRTVGAWLERSDLAPWFGDPVRRVMIIGTDAREWQDPVRFRGDSLHIVSSNTELGGGGILGFPRDSWIEAPYGTDKFTHVNAITWTESDKQVERDLGLVQTDPYLAATARWRGLDAVVEIIRQGPLGGEVTTDITEEMTGLHIEGYILTGFRDFQLLLNNYGSVMIDVPLAMRDAASQAYFDPGPQEMWGRFALAFSRNRHLRGGDFTRSFHQGMVILARLEAMIGTHSSRTTTHAAVPSGFAQLPYLMGALSRHTWTDLSLEQLLTLGAGALLLDPDKVGNEVLPGRVATRGGASVVLINDSAEGLYRDLDDGVLGNTVEEEDQPAESATAPR
jgi:polyisoprenyl-teichoic acid--peptidoglycan teichoic acid transferase